MEIRERYGMKRIDLGIAQMMSEIANTNVQSTIA
jgi:hypothetical protein